VAIFDDPEPAPARGPDALFAHTVALGGAGGLLWYAAGLGRQYSLWLPSLALQAFGYAFLAWLSYGACALAFYFVFSRENRGELLDSAFETSIAAIWFAPLTILLSHVSPGALIAAVALVITATRMVYREWRLGALEPVDAQPCEDGPALFYQPFLRQRSLARELAPSLAFAAVLQATGAAAALRYPILASGFGVAGAAMAAVFALSSGLWTPAPPPTFRTAARRGAATIALAGILTVAALTPRLLHGQHPFDATSAARAGLLESVRAVLRQLLYREKPAAMPLGADDQPETATLSRPPGAFPDGPEYTGRPAEAAASVDGDFPGVILWPQVKPVPVLIEPIPAGAAAYFGSTRALSIPFGGEYWMYRSPFERPPRGSYFQRGSPVSLSFSTTDHKRLWMEASQKLGQSISIRCCGEIRLEILNADRYPHTVALELTLVDRSTARRRSVSLGMQPVLSTPTGDAPSRETLSFPMPQSPPIDQFDQFKINFIRDPGRGDKSARIAIERFILAPRSI
jgi:hypothetical protein